MATKEDVENNGMVTPEVQPNKRRKMKSPVWEHFTIEKVDDSTTRAVCNQCKKSFVHSTGSKIAGNSHLKRHLDTGACRAMLRNQENSQLALCTPSTGGNATTRTAGNGTASEARKRRNRTPNSPHVPFDSDRCRHEMARMIVLHDYQLHMVEHSGFMSFVHNLQPHFGSVSFNTVQGDCVATYLREKQNVMKFIEGMPGRVCLSLDMWTSSRSIGYVFITGHFIDGDWKPRRQILNVVMEPYPNSDKAISHAVACCLADWNLEGKLFSVTSNHPVAQSSHESLRSLLCIKNPLVLNGQLLIGNCVARFLSSLAKDVLWEERVIIKKVHDCVKYVKTSESHEEKFVHLKQHLQVPTGKSLVLDDQTQWNTTYQMLLAASELKDVFSCLNTSNHDFKPAPSAMEWKHVESICKLLKPIFDAASVLSSIVSQPTAVIALQEIWKLCTELARKANDPFIGSVAKAISGKVDKYWKECSLVLAIAAVMDPRFKMKLVEFIFSKAYGEEAPAFIKIVDDGIHELFLEYVAPSLPSTPTYAETGNNDNIKTEDRQCTLLTDNGLTDFDAYVMENTSQPTTSELDRYLEESLYPRSPDFDILGWWKLNNLKYPTLTKMARDILAIQVSTASADSVFDTAMKELDPYRSSLRPETVEALVCAKDWLQQGPVKISNAIVQMEY